MADESIRLELLQARAELVMERLEVLPLPNAVDVALLCGIQRQGQQNAEDDDERFEAEAP